MIQGLYYQLCEMIAKRADGKARLADPEISANERHSLEWTSGDLERATERVEEQIGEDEDLAAAIGLVIESLQESPHKTRLRSLAINELEAAHDRLRRELGDKPDRVES